MTLNEQQLQNLFQNHSQKNHTETTASDVLNAGEASAQRLQQAEQLLNDHQSAQGFRLAVALKSWTQAIAQSIPASRPKATFLGVFSKLKWTFVAAAMALAIALPMTLHKTEQPMESTVTGAYYAHDSISASAFEYGSDDILSNNSFEGISADGEDVLFKSKFG